MTRGPGGISPAVAAGGLGVLLAATIGRRGNPGRGRRVRHRPVEPQASRADDRARSPTMRGPPIEYPDAVFDEQPGGGSPAPRSPRSATPPSPATRPTRCPGRLVVRRIPDLNPRGRHGQDPLFDTWRFHAFFTTTNPDLLDTVTADRTQAWPGTSKACARCRGMPLAAPFRQRSTHSGDLGPPTKGPVMTRTTPRSRRFTGAALLAAVALATSAAAAMAASSPGHRTRTSTSGRTTTTRRTRSSSRPASPSRST